MNMIIKFLEAVWLKEMHFVELLIVIPTDDW